MRVRKVQQYTLLRVAQVPHTYEKKSQQTHKFFFASFPVRIPHRI